MSSSNACPSIITAFLNSFGQSDRLGRYGRVSHAAAHLEYGMFGADESLCHVVCDGGGAPEFRIESCPHRRRFLGVLQGSITLSVNSEPPQRVQPHDLLALWDGAEGLTLQRTEAGRAEFFILELGQDKAEHNIWPQSRSHFNALLPLSTASRAIQAINRLNFDITASHRRKYLLYSVHASVCAVIAEASASQAPSTYRSDRFALAELTKAIITENLFAPQTLETIAKKLGTNRTKLAKSFKSVFGTTVFEYWQQQRMVLAKSMLDQRGLSVKEVAQRVGYEHPGNFSAAFKKYFGEAPKRKGTSNPRIKNQKT